jgi:hypothetical protein
MRPSEAGRFLEESNSFFTRDSSVADSVGCEAYRVRTFYVNEIIQRSRSDHGTGRTDGNVALKVAHDRSKGGGAKEI